MSDSPRPDAAQRPSSPVLLTQKLAVTKRVGEGSISTVYAAVHAVLARRFAVKVIHRSLLQSEVAVKRFRHVVRDISQLHHPNVINLADFGQLSDGRFYVTMDYIHGVQLEQSLREQGRMSLDRAIPLLVQLGEALFAAHRQHLSHGDVKPSNILLTPTTDGPDLLYLYDFGLSAALRPLSSHDAEGRSDVVITHNYLAPEQVAGHRSDWRADIYGFGAVAYHMITGEPPFVGTGSALSRTICNVPVVPPSRRSGVGEVPFELEQLIVRCLAKEPSHRPFSIEEVLADLRPRAASAIAGMPEEESVTQRWRRSLSWEGEEEKTNVEIPPSPARLRRLLQETILDLALELDRAGCLGRPLRRQLHTLIDLRNETAHIVGQIDTTENRFEDIRRELGEEESALRYDLIDLTLAKSETTAPLVLSEIELQITKLNARLNALDDERQERFSLLNNDLKRYRDRWAELEEKKATLYRYLQDGLAHVKATGAVGSSHQLFHQLERYAQAAGQATAVPGTPAEERPSAVRRARAPMVPDLTEEAVIL